MTCWIGREQRMGVFLFHFLVFSDHALIMSRSALFPWLLCVSLCVCMCVCEWMGDVSKSVRWV